MREFNVLFNKLLINIKNIIIIESDNLCDWNANKEEWGLGTGDMNLIPPIDHTIGTDFGRYAVVNSPNTDATLSTRISNAIVTNLQSSQDLCLRFWVFYNSKLNNDTLTIMVSKSDNTKSVIIKTYSPALFLQNQWLYMTNTINAAYHDRIELISNASLGSVIAIDDINLLGRRCEYPGFCDFESGNEQLKMFSMCRCSIKSLQIPYFCT